MGEGHTELFAIHRHLTLRRELPAAATRGFPERVHLQTRLWFERCEGSESLPVNEPRHATPPGFSSLDEVWKVTHVHAPWCGSVMRDIFTGREHAGPALDLSESLSDLPIAALM